MVRLRPHAVRRRQWPPALGQSGGAPVPATQALLQPHEGRLQCYVGDPLVSARGRLAAVRRTFL
eukprot:10917013-Lingulodinium_polyedra.AAC.1